MSMHKYMKQNRDKSSAELSKLVGELKSEQFQIRFDRATGKLENYRRIPETKRKLAVVMTLLRAKQIEAESGKGGAG